MAERKNEMKDYKVFLGYPDTSFSAIPIQARSEKAANKVAYYMWLAWALNNDIDGSNYYVEELTIKDF